MAWRWFLQQALGGVKRIPDSKLLEVEGGGHGTSCRLGLTSQVVLKLLTGRAPVVACKSAVPAEVCEHAAARLDRLDNQFETWYLGVDKRAPPTDYRKLGLTKTDMLSKYGIRMTAFSGAPQRYLQEAAQVRKLLQEDVFAPHTFPLDAIQEEISALPGFRCHLESCPKTDAPFLPCVVRKMLPGGRRLGGNVHMDTVAPGSALSINVYLRVPHGSGCGGELVLYPVQKGMLSRALNSHFFSAIDIQNFYPDRKFYTDALLPEPIVYQPQVGDVVLIDPAYPHAVKDFTTSDGLPRLSLQTFAQVSWEGSWQGPHRVLQYAV